jgi:ABC-type multidrug transport system fused ATPase/permease subunit
VLFSGSIRSNLDPFDEFDDERLSQVLERVGLRQDTMTVVNSLADRVLENGSNFSVGQRQLLVIARALLGGASVVICDEGMSQSACVFSFFGGDNHSHQPPSVLSKATSAVDAETDSRIQRVLRDDFKDTTCLTIAHRLNTIMDSDYILVMSDGQAVEFDPPQRLLSRTNSVFKKLVDQWSEDQQK